MTTKDKPRKRLKDYSVRGCPLTKNHSKWCFRLCEFDENNRGLCGRVAPHAYRGVLQQAIADYKERTGKIGPHSEAVNS